MSKIKVTIRITKKVELSRYDKEKLWSAKYNQECEVGETFTHFKKRIILEQKEKIKKEIEIKRKELERNAEILNNTS